MKREMETLMLAMMRVQKYCDRSKTPVEFQPS